MPTSAHPPFFAGSSPRARAGPRHAALALFVALWLLAPTALAQAPRGESGNGPIYVVPITGTIDLGLAPYLSRVLEQAEADGAAAVVLEIDTPGGRLDAVLQMRDALLRSPLRTIAFVDQTAFSAGALIAIASTEIYMTPGAVLGAATPVDGAGEAASEKIISAVSTTFRATAEARGRDPQVAAAMVDPDVAIDGLVERGKLLTLTTSEASAWGYADGVVDDRTELLAAAGLTGSPIVESAPSLAEEAVRFITDPLVASLLIILGFLLIIGDSLVEGFGIAGAAGLAFLAVFFWGHYLAGLAGWEDVALVLVGLVLLGLELFVVPGFGVPGILGIAGLLGGLFLAMLGRDFGDFTFEGFEQAVITIAVSSVAIVIGFVAVLVLLPRNRRIRGLVLQTAVGRESPQPAAAPADWLKHFGAPARLPRGSRPDEAEGATGEPSRVKELTDIARE